MCYRRRRPFCFCIRFVLLHILLVTRYTFVTIPLSHLAFLLTRDGNVTGLVCLLWHNFSFSEVAKTELLVGFTLPHLANACCVKRLPTLDAAVGIDLHLALGAEEGAMVRASVLNMEMLAGAGCWIYP